VQIEYRGASGEWVPLPDQVVTDGRGYFSVTFPQAQAGEYRFQWIRPDAGAGAAADHGPIASSTESLSGPG
jgi:hypothetical protein